MARGSEVGLRTRLIAVDTFALVAAALAAQALSGWELGPSLATVVTATGAGLLAARSQGLYESARCSIRSVEFTGIVRASLLLGLALWLAGSVGVGDGDPASAALAAALSTVLLSIGRAAFGRWLREVRADGRYSRTVVVVGGNADAARLVRVLSDHPEAGYRVVGVCADDEDSLRHGLRSMWRGGPRDAAALIETGTATGGLVVASALDPEELNEVVRQIRDAGGHVHLSSGLWGIDAAKIGHSPIAREPLLHLGPRQLTTTQLTLKRVVDVIVAGALLVLTAPLTLGAMLAIRLSDGGPALFRQVRVGKDDEPFEVLKLRTMVVDAEEQVDDLQCENERTGPLFKVDDDPRVTRLGRFLRASSIDELPQFWNVLRGEMSVVGPRPALPEEVAAFPVHLRPRTNVLPGITGLWQVEARDNPSFEAYERFDLFYVDNWTITFDLVIMLTTVEAELARAWTRLRHRRRSSTPECVAVARDVTETDGSAAAQPPRVGADPRLPTPSTLSD